MKPMPYIIDSDGITHIVGEIQLSIDLTECGRVIGVGWYGTSDPPSVCGSCVSNYLMRDMIAGTTS